ncbi:hypothetical protein ACGC1H_000850 [Rhizoctonia solani]
MSDRPPSSVYGRKLSARLTHSLHTKQTDNSRPNFQGSVLAHIGPTSPLPHITRPSQRIFLRPPPLTRKLYSDTPSHDWFFGLSLISFCARYSHPLPSLPPAGRHELTLSLSIPSVGPDTSAHRNMTRTDPPRLG